ncbi:MAG: acyltransferase, partial [Candidatus Accumulibacter sp.]|nr:acyltransferase [Accumulibacter sp.]
MQPPTQQAPARYRPDIDGLRAIAIMAVVFYHAGFPGFSGGFVGVDVFFVISGFLITALLFNEAAATGRVSLSAFYARRVRRLMPAGLLVVAATLLLGALFMP